LPHTAALPFLLFRNKYVERIMNSAVVYVRSVSEKVKSYTVLANKFRCVSDIVASFDCGDLNLTSGRHIARNACSSNLIPLLSHQIP
jgi:hypothetical protein